MNLPKALVLTAAATTFCLMTSPAFAVQETTPQNIDPTRVIWTQP